jgi:hypothetical protein
MPVTRHLKRHFRTKRTRPCTQVRILPFHSSFENARVSFEAKLLRRTVARFYDSIHPTSRHCRYAGCPRLSVWTSLLAPLWSPTTGIASRHHSMYGILDPENRIGTLPCSSLRWTCPDFPHSIARARLPDENGLYYDTALGCMQHYLVMRYSYAVRVTVSRLAAEHLSIVSSTVWNGG